jgi:N-acetylmuramoyl-L-alanine amidase
MKRQNTHMVFLKFAYILCLLMLPILVFSQQAYKLKTVVIDAGHGGKDPGAVGSMSKEKDIVLAIALKTGAYIKQHFPDVTVIYTRETDVFVELHKRAEIANKNNADLFISIHANANKNKSAYGTDSWVMGLHRTKENLEVAKLENKVISIEDNYETRYQGMSAEDTDAIIIHTMMQSANLELSATFATYVQTQFRERVGRKDRGVHSAPFLVLWRTTMPSVLIETGFISNLEEEKYLNSEEGQTYLASAIFRAFRDYKNILEKKTNFGVDTTAISRPSLPTVVAPSPPPPQPQPQSQLQQTPVVNQISETKSDIYFSIQLASSQTLLQTNPENFLGLKNVFILHENNWNRYLVGKETTYQGIRNQLDAVKEKYPSAFIVAVQNNTRINLQDAIKLTQ